MPWTVVSTHPSLHLAAAIALRQALVFVVIVDGAHENRNLVHAVVFVAGRGGMACPTM
jgi:hypothetical protein